MIRASVPIAGVWMLKLFTKLWRRSALADSLPPSKFGAKRTAAAAFDHDYRLVQAHPELFSTSYYLKKNQDVVEAKFDPIFHYLKHGWKEGRIVSVNFDGEFYLKANPDIDPGSTNPLLHYIKQGMPRAGCQCQQQDARILCCAEALCRRRDRGVVVSRNSKPGRGGNRCHHSRLWPGAIYAELHPQRPHGRSDHPLRTHRH